jgi:hypothetical protein
MEFMTTRRAADGSKKNMRGMNSGFERCFGGRHLATVALAIFALPVVVYPRAGLAETSRQQTFASAKEASDALIAAVKNQDQPAITKILGAGKNLTSLDDEVQNKVERELFLHKYQEMHRLVPEPDGSTVLYVGAENWPFPVPLVSRSGVWYFDSTAGAQEVLFRRIGENEGATINACHTLVLAERQRQTNPAFDSASQYSEAPSAFRPLLTSTGNGTAATQNKDPNPAIQNRDPVSFHGYYFRVLTRQGKNAPGAARSYVADGKANRGFAFIAYPMEYRSSGVMTFIINQDDVVYEKDLGPNTAKRARSMTQYNPDSTWQAAE